MVESEGYWSGSFASVPAQETYSVKFLLWSGEDTLEGYWFPMESYEATYTESNSTESGFDYDCDAPIEGDSTPVESYIPEM